jgi:hypothetical protein
VKRNPFNLKSVVKIIKIDIILLNMCTYVSELSRAFPSMAREEQVRVLCELTSFITKMSRGLLNINMFDNYNHRTLQVYECLSHNASVNHLVINPKRTGKDAWCDLFKNIEIKTSKGRYPIYLFDKQNNEIRRQQMYDYDAFAFANFEDELLIRCVFVHDPESVHGMRRMFSDKQQIFLQKLDKAVMEGKRGYDTICITNKDLAKVNVDVYESGVWNPLKKQACVE